MTKRTKLIALAGSVVAVAAAGTGVAVSSGGGEDEGPDQAIQGSALDRASAAALDHTGGGRVTGTEVGDEESYYEVEVTKDGSQTDVQLDRDFNVVSDEADDENEDESGENEN